MAFVALVERMIDLLDPQANLLLNATLEQATAAVRSGDAAKIAKLEGQFALLAKDGQTVRMARTLGRPMRYFLAKQAAGPCLIVAERIDEIKQQLVEMGLADQFHPSYTRMVPAHHLLELRLIGCPDPQPTCTRFVAPQRNRLPADINSIGQAYIGAVAHVCQAWLDQLDEQEPIGVLFSGGVDSGALFLILHHLILQRGQSPARLKAFTLSVGGQPSDSQQADSQQAREFLRALDLELFLEVVQVGGDAINLRETVRTIEDYKPLDVQAAAMGLTLCRAIRRRYPDWRVLVDGDGGDENLKDYPIHENPELTIRSVLNNLMLYQEGWGVDAVKHSLTYSGGQSRGHVRTYAPARSCGFSGFSPFAEPSVVGVAEGIPFIELTDWDEQRLYALKGQIVAAGVEALTGMKMPIFEKRRFQRGAVDAERFTNLFPANEEAVYRRMFSELHG